jgi:TetR/AcrR family transcriptional regulator, transcriptional repressor for nem operon
MGYRLWTPALVRAVIEYQADTVVGGQEHFDLSSLGGWREWPEFVVGHERSRNCRGGCPMGSLGSQVSETEPDAREAVAAGFKRWEGTIRTGLQKMHQLGRPGPEADPTSSPSPPLAALQGGLLLAQVERDTKPLEAALDAMIALVASHSGGAV